MGVGIRGVGVVWGIGVGWGVEVGIRGVGVWWGDRGWDKGGRGLVGG